MVFRVELDEKALQQTIEDRLKEAAKKGVEEATGSWNVRMVIQRAAEERLSQLVDQIAATKAADVPELEKKVDEVLAGLIKKKLKKAGV